MLFDDIIDNFKHWNDYLKSGSYEEIINTEDYINYISTEENNVFTNVIYIQLLNPDNFLYKTDKDILTDWIRSFFGHGVIILIKITI